jgi:lysophospholipase L1-like esterase
LPILPKRTSDIARTIANDPKSISKELYKDKHEDYLIDVLSDLIEYMQIGVSYFPHTEYCETPFKSKTLNICTDPTGVTYRTGHKKCFVDIDSSTYRVYILGGSTSFGVFVADSETWPSRLSKLLMLKYPNRKIEVVNYAVTGYSITEEFLRLYDLVKLGHRPSMVIVLDGLNLGMESDQSRFTNSFFYTIKNIQTSYSFKETISRLLINMPISQLLLQMAPTKVLLYFFIRKASQEASNSPLEFYSDKSVVNFQSNRFNKGISDIQHLCNQFNIKLLYCLQPNAFYNYNIDSCSACTEIPNKTYKEDVGKIYSSILSNHPDVIDMTNLFSKFHNKQLLMIPITLYHLMLLSQKN